MEGQTKVSSPISSSWILPADVMRNRKLKAKRRALHSRMNTSLPLQILSPRQEKRNNIHPVKRKYSPSHSSSKTETSTNDSDSSELSCDVDFFQKYASPSSKKELIHLLKSSQEPSSQNQDKEKKPEQVYSPFLKADWSLKTKLRLVSSKPIPWKHTFRSSEEASGTTGFVRCMDPQSSSSNGMTLDTSKNAQFYQCSLVWQHPNLPMLPLFPRVRQYISSQSGLFGINKELAGALLEDWKESLRSLFHLVRVRQCPYFYVCGHSFTCLFRAAGMAGIPHAHALVTPTTYGFREEMKKEGIEFSMPFMKNEESSISDNNDEEVEFNEEPDEDTGDQTSWLEDLGIEASKIASLNHNKPSRSSDSLRANQLNSLVLVEDMELHGFFNFLLNCTTCISITGPLSGVPPTLLSPVAFHGGSLKALKVSGGVAKAKDGNQFHHLELLGPILPSSVLQLTSLFSNNSEDFSMTLLAESSTLPFSNVVSSDKNEIPSAFAEEGLVDCGLSRQFCTTLCKPIEPNAELPASYKDVSYSNKLYTWK